MRPGAEAEIAFDAIPGRVFPGIVAVSQGQLQATGTLLHSEDRWNGIRQYRYHRRFVDLLCNLQRRVPETNCNVQLRTNRLGDRVSRRLGRKSSGSWVTRILAASASSPWLPATPITCAGQASASGVEEKMHLYRGGFSGMCSHNLLVVVHRPAHAFQRSAPSAGDIDQ